MVSQTFLSTKPQPRRLQPPSRRRVKVILSKEARVVLAFERRRKAQGFRDDLDTTWVQLDEATKKIASTHHKSVKRVQRDLYLGHGVLRTKRVKVNAWNAFFWKKGRENQTQDAPGGKVSLPNLVQSFRDEYKKLSPSKKSALVEEFSKFREAKSFGFRVGAQSKVNDVTKTLKALNNLRCRTGTETILYATRGSTDVPLNGVAFATEGVQDFMGTVMGIDNQDMVSKMEGFAIQGIKGAASNHAQLVSQVRAAIRNIINQKLRETTGDQEAKMQWAHYFRNVVQRHSVVIEGWPDGIPFSNLSSISSALSQLETLLRKWESGTTYWKQLTEDEFEELRAKRNQQLEDGEINDHTRRTRSDKGKKRKRISDLDNGDNSRRHHAGKGKNYKSAAVIESEHEDDTQDGPAANANQSIPSSPTSTAALAAAFANMSSGDHQRLLSNLDTVPMM
ncbi:hypothetical protein HYDPIDRAFT_103757 [Hydnomerulius pinastri MD-312]|uniref:Unplaced genomic scaffold scaffold_255, whole genome shotgun sequence n=1 Tax=Hydnomerulius pinastri MD-312 TaxID=994086 RepID=A0A0C9VK26_9AGAM|nr:hypothetical protein HYDPIDRAFT_103757 [Hydnomerulius pinastri MD-312]